MITLPQSPHHHHSSDERWSSNDTEADYQQNLERLGEEWRFRTVPVSYKWNRQGYRMVELEEIDQSNYILFLGCSFAVGIGLPLEETYPYQIAAQLGLGTNYVNASINGGSPSTVVLNLVSLLSTALTPPLAVHINWPSPHRQHYWYKDTIQLLLPNYRPHPHPGDLYWRHAYETTIGEDSHIRHTWHHLVATAATLCKLGGIPLVQMTTHGDSALTHPHVPHIPRATTVDLAQAARHRSIHHINRVFARDIQQQSDRALWAHPGIYHQDLVVQHFFTRYQQ